MIIIVMVLVSIWFLLVVSSKKVALQPIPIKTRKSHINSHRYRYR